MKEEINSLLHQINVLDNIDLNSNNIAASASASTSTSTTTNESHKEEEWIDILPVLSQASESMSLGQLIHAKDFQLELVTHALEIMNPKLDSRASGNHIYTPEQLFQKGEIPEDSTLSNLQILKIIDKLLCYEISWVEGDPLPLTLFSCMYLHIAEQLKNEIFSLYVNTLLISCESINLIVQRGDICFEEDFNHSTNNLHLITSKNDCASKILPMLDRLEKQFEKSIKEEQDSEKVKIMKSLLNRITFRRLFYSIVFNLSQNYCQTAIRYIQDIQPVLEFLKNDCYIKDEIELPKSIFNNDLVLKLFSSVGGTSQEKPFAETVKSFAKLFTDLSTLFKMPYISESSLEFQRLRQLEKQLESTKKGSKQTIQKPQTFNVVSILDYLFYFSKFSPNIITRSLLRRLLFPYTANSNEFFKVSSLRESLFEWMNDFGIPFQILHSQKAKERISLFMDSLAQVLLKLFTYLLLNRARQRRKIRISIYELSLLQNEGDIIDSVLAADPLNTKLYFGSFVFNLKLKVMQYFLFLGFELEVYAPNEYYQIYFYLDYLYGIHSNIYSYIFRINHPEKPKTGKKSHQQQLQQQQPTPTCERILLTATHLVVRAIFRFMVILKSCGKFIILPTEFSNDDLRHMKKFEPFFNPPNQQPEPLPMERVRDSGDTDEHWLSLAATTLDFLNQAKLAIETIRSYKHKIGNVAPYQEDEASQLRLIILRLSLTIKKLIPSNFESLSHSEILKQPIPKFSVQIEPKQYFPNFIINLEK
ncbi:hypothetical protein DICPUDRAFT_146727 [Dictyostelium purpureum]|uniref:Uncharacterized protein n=1 Tax=Dictyostelium purpureum TaxID=5786 RepID=F0Z6V5_DICPU|nr:uncharacterized protein DICPUDRAFT_146727 [Dictyostelium purpureum]EGC40375.1 hypothetical protein DICPUDRAFT_146727 [Dictyostelium purpureum]|eukprot:XP_003283126.1 hypothetical protein DICPUDRAFT_146727 [Dictyostelium purpureum]